MLLALLAWPAFGALGCLTVTIYQPQHAIHRPVVVDRAADNFAGMKILVRCVSHDEHMPPASASKMCGKVAEEFNQQGAETEIVVPVGATFVEPRVFEGALPDLSVEIVSRIEHSYLNPFTLGIAIATLTLAPAIEEYTFSQRVRVLGRDGSVLTEEVFRERFVDYTGIGVWTTNYLLDWFVREKSEALSGDAPKKDFTRDFYGQIRQLAFNARIRSEVLGLTRGPANKRKQLVEVANPEAVDDGGTGAPEAQEGATETGADEAPESLPGLGADPAEGGG